MTSKEKPLYFLFGSEVGGEVNITELEEGVKTQNQKS